MNVCVRVCLSYATFRHISNAPRIDYISRASRNIYKNVKNNIFLVFYKHAFVSMIHKLFNYWQLHDVSKCGIIILMNLFTHTVSYTVTFFFFSYFKLIILQPLESFLQFHFF